MEKNNIKEQIMNKIERDIHIQRVPKHAKKWFLDYANDYFEGDYGMTLKHIIDTFRGMTPIGYDELQEQITMLQNELELVKATVMQPKEDKDVVRMANGIERRKN